MKYIAGKFSTFAQRDEGAVAVVFALAAVLLFAAAGVAIDFARAAHARTELQTALDSAVLAGVRASGENRISVATEIFNANFSDGGTKKVSASFSPTDDDELAGNATGLIGTTLSGLLGIDELKINVTAKAIAIGDIDESVACVLVLAPNASQAFLVNSGPDVQADCEIHVKSTANPAAIFNAGSRIETKRICIEGTQIIDNGGVHPHLDTGCATTSDPYAGKIPEPSSGACTYSNLNFNGGNVTLNPGTYCGWINFNGSPNVTFNPGLYIIKNGGWNVNGGNWTGTGVTFYFADQSKIQFNSGVAADIKAPTSGTYKNIVMFEKPGLQRSQFVFNDSRGMNLQGVIYLPSRDVTFNSRSSLTNRKMTIVVYTLILNNTRWDLQAATDEMSTNKELQSVRLVK